MLPIQQLFYFNFSILIHTFLSNRNEKLNFEKFIESNKGLKGKKSKTENKFANKNTVN